MYASERNRQAYKFHFHPELLRPQAVAALDVRANRRYAGGRRKEDRTENKEMEKPEKTRDTSPDVDAATPC